jgi:hypothetical protein
MRRARSVAAAVVVVAEVQEHSTQEAKMRLSPVAVAVVEAKDLTGVVLVVVEAPAAGAQLAAAVAKTVVCRAGVVAVVGVETVVVPGTAVVAAVTELVEAVEALRFTAVVQVVVVAVMPRLRVPTQT